MFVGRWNKTSLNLRVICAWWCLQIDSCYLAHATNTIHTSKIQRHLEQLRHCSISLDACYQLPAIQKPWSHWTWTLLDLYMNTSPYQTSPSIRKPQSLTRFGMVLAAVAVKFTKWPWTISFSNCLHICIHIIWLAWSRISHNIPRVMGWKCSCRGRWLFKSHGAWSIPFSFVSDRTNCHHHGLENHQHAWLFPTTINCIHDTVFTVSTLES